MFLSAILLDLGVDVLHQAVPLHQHVRERRAGEDAHHLRRYGVSKEEIIFES